MYNLLRFVKQYQFILLFVIIESFSIFLLVSNNNYQRVKLLEATTEYTSAFYKYSNNLIDYFRLKKTNQYLIDENAKLHSLLRSQTFNIDTMLNVKNNFSYHGAKVINNSISKRNNHLTLNKGRKHGFTKGMGVVTSKGVIGIIKSTSKKGS